LANALLVSNVSPDIGINHLPLKNDRESEFGKQFSLSSEILRLFPGFTSLPLIYFITFAVAQLKSLRSRLYRFIVYVI
jgi:hypothetical protein